MFRYLCSEFHNYLKTKHLKERGRERKIRPNEDIRVAPLFSIFTENFFVVGTRNGKGFKAKKIVPLSDLTNRKRHYIIINSCNIIICVINTF